jgi:hypothetical protein
MSEELLKILSLYGYITAIQDYLKFRISRVEKVIIDPVQLDLGGAYYFSIIAYDHFDKPYLVITIYSKDDYILNRLGALIDALELIIKKSLSKQ